jgi:cytochrome c-type biogenesis protein CcmF
MQIMSLLEVTQDGRIDTLKPVYEIRENRQAIITDDALSWNSDISFAVTRINANDRTILVKVNGLDENQSQINEVLLIEASIKPYINVLWLGTYILTIGFLISFYRRTKENDMA